MGLREYKTKPRNNDKQLFTYNGRELISKKSLYGFRLWFYKTNVKFNLVQDERSCFLAQIKNDFPEIFKKNKTGVAVDVGARVGEWSRQFGLIFDKVISFEAREKWCECFTKNVMMENVSLYNYALGNTNSWAVMNGNSIEDSGDQYKYSIAPTATHGIKILKLDTFNLEQIDFLKIDTDGYELDVLRGGESTILKTKPIILIECQVKNKGDKYPEFCKYLSSLGAKVLKEYGTHKYDIHDRLYGWD